MGREVRRVPLDFDWPLNQPWQGFLMPDRLQIPDCEDCGGHGVTTAHRWVEASAAMILLLTGDLRAQQAGRPMHPYFASYPTSAHGTRPSPDIAELTAGLAGRPGDGFMGHDAIDRWAATRKIIEAAGLDPETWGRCQTCGGHGGIEAYPGQRAESEAWEPTDPPEGEGWQYWETVSEGSPISPVFATREGLVDWLCTEYRWGASGPLTREQAEGMVSAGWAPSMVMSAATGLRSGDEVAGQ